MTTPGNVPKGNVLTVSWLAGILSAVVSVLLVAIVSHIYMTQQATIKDVTSLQVGQGSISTRLDDLKAGQTRLLDLMERHIMHEESRMSRLDSPKAP